MTGNFKHISEFKDSVENKCIHLLVEAYNQSITDKLIQLNWEENDITKQLSEYIENNPLRKGNPFIMINVEHNLSKITAKKTKGFAAKSLRIDLCFATFKSEEEYKVFFEAKNLREKDSALKRRYIDTGIDNFVTEKYPQGFLVGYLLEGAVSPTIDGINNLLKKDNREKECLYPKNHKTVKYYYESNHSELCLKHLIFDFTVL
ncbi:MAG: hypothetical protein LBC64_11640 [Fibromonadaceae bacterium]|jgi:hypothetical protein|nr:hypothetical protein [Fibromonadaceae bacterium]